VELVLSEQVDLVAPFIGDGVEVDFAGFGLLQELLQGHRVGPCSEAIFDVDLVEEGYHILCLVFGVIEMFYSIVYHDHYYLVRRNPGLVQKLQIALLNALYGRLQHVLRLAVHTNAYRQLYPPILRPSKQRQQPIARQPFRGVLDSRRDVQVLYFLLVDLDGPHRSLFELVGVVLCAADDLDAFGAVQPYLFWLEEDLREEVLALEQVEHAVELSVVELFLFP
jgi:hypothetical protein